MACLRSIRTHERIFLARIRVLEGNEREDFPADSTNELHVILPAKNSLLFSVFSSTPKEKEEDKAAANGVIESYCQFTTHWGTS